MKVALCLFGEPRFYNSYAYTTIKKIIDTYNCDVFFHTYKCDNYNLGPWTGISVNKDEISADKNIDELIRLYEPRRCKIEKSQDMPIDPSRVRPDIMKKVYNSWGHQHTLNHILCMYHSIKESIGLKASYEKKHNFTYDFVIRTRFDLAIDVIPRLEDLDKGVFYVPNFMKPHNFYTITDHFSISNSSDADKSSYALDNFYECVNKIGDIAWEGIFSWNVRCIHKLSVCLDSRIHTKISRSWDKTDPNPNEYYDLKV